MSSDMYTSTNTGSGTVLKDYDYTDGVETYNGQVIHWFKAVDPAFYNSGSYKLLVNSQSVELAPGHDYEMNFFTGLSWKGEYTVTIRIVGYGDVFSKDYQCSATSYTNITRVRFTAPDSLNNFSRFIIEISVPEKYQYGSAGENARFMISENFELQDRTDDPSWLYKILKKFDEIGDYLSGVGQSITSGFTNLGNKIGSFFDSLEQSVSDWFSDVGEWFEEQKQKIQDFSDSVGQWFEDLKLKIENSFQAAVDEVKSWFIPHEGYFDEYAAVWKEWAAEHFGVLVQIPEIFIDVLDRLSGVISTNSYTFTFPEISLPIAGKTYVFVQEQTVDMDYWLNGSQTVGYLYDIYTVIVWSVFVFALFKYAQVLETTILGVREYGE